MRRLKPLALLLIGGCAAQPPMQPSLAPMRTPNAAAELLQYHNRERAAVGVAPLSWDPALAQAAAAYAGQLASLGLLRHSPRTARPGQGENLWMGTPGAYRVQQMAGAWISERRFFRPGLFPAVSTTGNWADVGHYSQIIWPTTTRLGCAIARSPRAEVLVCRYAPAGNIDGRRVP